MWVAWVCKILVFVNKFLIWSLKFGLGPKLGARLMWVRMGLEKFNHKLSCLFSLFKNMHRLNFSVTGLAWSTMNWSNLFFNLNLYVSLDTRSNYKQYKLNHKQSRTGMTGTNLKINLMALTKILNLLFH